MTDVHNVEKKNNELFSQEYFSIYLIFEHRPTFRQHFWLFCFKKKNYLTFLNFSNLDFRGLYFRLRGFF